MIALRSDPCAFYVVIGLWSLWVEERLESFCIPIPIICQWTFSFVTKGTAVA